LLRVPHRSAACWWVIVALAGLGGPAGAQPPPTVADQAKLLEADRLFDDAVAHWNESVSARVEQDLLRALALRQSVLPPTDPRVAQAQDQLGRVYYNRGIGRADPGPFQRAEKLFAAAAAAASQSLGPRDLTYAAYLGDLGAALREQHRYAEATRAVCHSLTIRRAVLPADDPLLSASLDNLSRIAYGEGQVQEAMQLQADVRRLRDRAVGSDDPAARALDKFCAAVPVS
jgi:tetratricopeptide (TPR) repeat protein